MGRVLAGCLGVFFCVSTVFAAGGTGESRRQNVQLQPWMVLVLSTVAAAFGYGVYRLVKTEQRRKEQFASFMKGAQQEFTKLNAVPSAVVQAHERLRVELFTKLFQGSEQYRSLEEADELVQVNGTFPDSWQRKLPVEAKQELKTALLRRAIATLPFYEKSRKDYGAKHLLFQRQLINDEHWQAVQACYENVCQQLSEIIFDANCVEDGWGSRPDGLFRTASIIIQHEAAKQREEEMKRNAARQAEKQKLKEQKLKAQQESQERERSERQKRLANATCEELLRPDRRKKAL